MFVYTDASYLDLYAKFIQLKIQYNGNINQNNH